jgi:hypothetical protein
MKMWRNKKIIIVAAVVAVIAALSITGVALAQTDDSSDNPETTLLAKVATILGIDQQTVEDAFAQAQSEIQSEALDSRLADMVSQGTITQEEADQYKAWYESKPDVSIPGLDFEGRGMGHGHGWGAPSAPPDNQSAASTQSGTTN